MKKRLLATAALAAAITILTLIETIYLNPSSGDRHRVIDFAYDSAYMCVVDGQEIDCGDCPECNGTHGLYDDFVIRS